MGTGRWQPARGVWHLAPTVAQPAGPRGAWPQDVSSLVWPWHSPVGVQKDLPVWEEASLPGTEPERDGQGLGLSTASVWLRL